MSKPFEPVYEDRLILFVDFLGFRETVNQTMEDTAVLVNLVLAIDELSSLGREDIHQSKRVTQFSDSLVLSYRTDEESAVFWLLNDLALTIVEVVDRGFLLRGAITVGPLLHTEKYLIGPAMVDAYHLESNVADSPRVIVDPKVLDVARKSHIDIHSADEEEEFVRGFLTTDIDGQFFIDYVSWESVIAHAGCEAHLYSRYLSHLGNIIERGLRDPNAKVRKKNLWLHSQYVAAIELASNVSPDADFRIENPGLCEEIEALPRLTDLARLAEEVPREESL